MSPVHGFLPNFTHHVTAMASHVTKRTIHVTPMKSRGRTQSTNNHFSFSFPKSPCHCFSSSSSSPTSDPDRNPNSAATMSYSTQRVQNIIVMRHGDRIDNIEPLWITTSKRPWDPPLVEAGKVRAFCTGRKLRNNLGFPIHRVIVSPFTRCIQTASEVVSALAAINDDDPLKMTSEEISIDPKKIKVSIEYGLCEIISRDAIRPDYAPKNAEWGFSISELETKFPAGTVDSTHGRLYQEMPKWEEPLLEARARYARVIRALADKFPSENLVLVTHGEGVGIAISAFMKETSVYEVEYCAYAHLQRQISSSSKDLEVVTKNGQTGIGFCPTSSMSLDV